MRPIAWTQTGDERESQTGVLSYGQDREIQAVYKMMVDAATDWQGRVAALRRTIGATEKKMQAELKATHEKMEAELKASREAMAADERI